MKRTAPKSYTAIYDAIFSRIVQGQFRPIHRIGITSLAQALGVSTTPVREALRQLAGRDLVVERHREGFYLAPLNARAIVSLYDAHEYWMDRALQHALCGVVRAGRHRSLWRSFDSRAAATSDVAIMSIRRYLDDRLAVVRRHESAMLSNMGERAMAFAEALARDDPSVARDLSHSFHEDCRQMAGQLASAFEGQGHGP
ncbi:GntR family transcriptional regulator [Sphingobium yanoikuyae]|jgi:DNA-binding GntR family transcriptional regulator|uniref:GntR family transcriptional regulator n=1 Tax=Sphingobium yanoikuyae TaxID=13690 RepID=UPI003B8F47F0